MFFLSVYPFSLGLTGLLVISNYVTATDAITTIYIANENDTILLTNNSPHLVTMFFIKKYNTVFMI